MQNIKWLWTRIITIAIVAAVLDVIFHALLAPTYPYDYPASYFIRQGIFKPTAGIALLIIYILLAVVFRYIQGNLSGSELSKGFRFGISFGGLWLIGLPGMTIFFGSPFLHELLGGICDCAAMIILGVLLGVFTATSSIPKAREDFKSNVLAVVVIALFFIIGQYAAFLLMNGTSYFRISGVGTFIWTLILGLWVGITYCMLKHGVQTDSSLKKALIFGGVVVGINWLLFNLFVLLFVNMPFIDPIILAGLNIVSVILGVWFIEAKKIKKRSS